MPSLPEIPIAPELQRRTTERTRELLTVAALHYRTPMPAPAIRFDLRGQAAGQVRTRDGDTCVVRYNAALLAAHPEDFVARTVPHEAAHVVAFRLFGRHIRPHGSEWRAVMALFGVAPERCHSYAVAGLQTRHLRRYDYRCACRMHRLTSIRHNRVRGGQVYLCRRCGTPLEQIPARTSSSGA